MATRKNSRSSKHGNKAELKKKKTTTRRKITAKKTRKTKAKSSVKKQLNTFHRNTIRLKNNEPQFEILMDVPVNPLRRVSRQTSRLTDMRRTLMNEDAAPAESSTPTNTPTPAAEPAEPQPKKIEPATPVEPASAPTPMPEEPKELPAAPEITPLPEKPISETPVVPASTPEKPMTQPMATIHASDLPDINRPMAPQPGTPEPATPSAPTDPAPTPEMPTEPVTTPASEAPRTAASLPIHNVVMIRSVSPLQTPVAHSSREFVDSARTSRIPAVLVSSLIVVFAILMGTAIVGRLETGLPLASKSNTPANSAVAGAEIGLQTYRNNAFALQYPTNWTVETVGNTLKFTDTATSDAVTLTSYSLKTDFATWLTSQKKSIGTMTRVQDSAVLHYVDDAKITTHYLVGSDTVVALTGSDAAIARVATGFHFQ